MPKFNATRPRSLKIDKEKLVRAILDDLTSDLAGRASWMSMRKDRNAKFEGWLRTRDFPWPDAADVNLPIMMTQAIRLHAVLYNALVGIRPLFQTNAEHKANIKDEEVVTQHMNYQLLRQMDGEAKLDDMTMKLLQDGNVFPGMHWERKEKRVRDLRFFPIDADPDAVIADLFKDKELLASEPQGEFAFKVTYRDKQYSMDRVALVDFFPSDTELQVEIRHDKVVEHPQLVIPNIEDIIVPFNAKDIQKCARVGEHLILTVDDIERGRRTGYYDLVTDKDMEKIEKGASVSMTTSKPEAEIERDKDEMQGLDERPERAQGTQPVDVYRYYYRWDVDNDGLLEDIIAWVAHDADVLLKVKLLGDIYRTGMRPIINIPFFPHPNRMYGRGIPEMFEALSDVINMIHKQGLDAGSLANAPIGFYRATASSIKPETVHYELGTLFPLDDPTKDIIFPQMGNASQMWTFNELKYLEDWSNRLLGQGAVSFGQVPQGGAAALRTAKFGLALMAQGEVITNAFLKRLQRGFESILHYQFELNKQYLPPGSTFRVTGDVDPGADPFREINRENYDFDPRFIFSANSISTNPEVVRQTKLIVGQFLLAPLLIQMGIITPENVYNISRDFLKAQNERNYEQYITKPALPEPPVPIENAIVMMSQGVPVRPGPRDNHQKNIEKLTEFIQSNDIAQFPAEYMGLLRDYIQQSVQLLQQVGTADMAQGMQKGLLSAMTGGTPAGQQPMPPQVNPMAAMMAAPEEQV